MNGRRPAPYLFAGLLTALVSVGSTSALEGRSPRAIYALMGEIDLSPRWERGLQPDGR
jgi:hypothetical protein